MRFLLFLLSLLFFLQIVQETVLAQYQQALRRWEEARQQNDYAATDKKPSSNTSEKVFFFFILKQFWPFAEPPVASSLFSMLQEADAPKIKHPTARKLKVIYDVNLSWKYCANSESVSLSTAWCPSALSRMFPADFASHWCSCCVRTCRYCLCQESWEARTARSSAVDASRTPPSCSNSPGGYGAISRAFGMFQTFPRALQQASRVKYDFLPDNRKIQFYDIRVKVFMTP